MLGSDALRVRKVVRGDDEDGEDDGEHADDAKRARHRARAVAVAQRERHDAQGGEREQDGGHGADDRVAGDEDAHAPGQGRDQVEEHARPVGEESDGHRRADHVRGRGKDAARRARQDAAHDGDGEGADAQDEEDERRRNGQRGRERDRGRHEERHADVAVPLIGKGGHR